MEERERKKRKEREEGERKKGRCTNALVTASGFFAFLLLHCARAVCVHGVPFKSEKCSEDFSRVYFCAALR